MSDDVQITDWQQRVAVLAQEHRLRQFEIADLLVQGIEQFGATATYDYAESLFPQYARATFQSWVTVAKHFPSSIRIESDWLTFGHYQVAQGAERDSFRPDRDESEIQVAKEMVWLRQADERRLSVSALRDTIARNYSSQSESIKRVKGRTKGESIRERHESQRESGTVYRRESKRESKRERSIFVWC